MTKPTALVHYWDFKERLEYSANLSNEASWVAYYKAIWPDMLAAVRIDGNGVLQKRGIDRIIHLPSGREFAIDEKKRDKDYGDALLELFSVCQIDEASNRILDTNDRKLGWAVDPNKDCDFIAYAVPGKVRLLPYELLRLALKANFGEWRKNPGWYPKKAPNRGYWTVNIAVPWPVLWKAIEAATLKPFTEGGPMPAPIPVDTHQLFLWPGPERDATA